MNWFFFRSLFSCRPQKEKRRRKRRRGQHVGDEKKTYRKSKFEAKGQFFGERAKKQKIYIENKNYTIYLPFICESIDKHSRIEPFRHWHPQRSISFSASYISFYFFSLSFSLSPSTVFLIFFPLRSRLICQLPCPSTLDGIDCWCCALTYRFSIFSVQLNRWLTAHTHTHEQHSESRPKQFSYCFEEVLGHCVWRLIKMRSTFFGMIWNELFISLAASPTNCWQISLHFPFISVKTLTLQIYHNIHTTHTHDTQHWNSFFPCCRCCCSFYLFSMKKLWKGEQTQLLWFVPNNTLIFIFTAEIRVFYFSWECCDGIDWSPRIERYTI